MNPLPVENVPQSGTSPSPFSQVAKLEEHRAPSPKPAPFPTPEIWTDAASFCVETIRGLEALRNLEPAWQDLADVAVEPNPFYEPWAALPALECFDPEGKVFFVAVFRNCPSGRKGERQLCGLFPLESRRAAGRLPVPMLGMWRHPYSYLGIPLLRSGLAPEVLQTFFDWMAEGGRDRGLLRIEDLPGDGPVRRCIVDEFYRRGWTSAITQTFTRAFFRPAASAEKYYERNINGRRRKEFRRKLNRLSEQGNLEWSELKSGEPHQRWADDFAELEARGWKGREGVAVASRENHMRFFQELIRHAALRDRLMLLGLRLNGKPIAMKLNLLSRGGSMAFKITYDEAWGQYSPGVQLELENIRRLHDRPAIPWMDSCAAPNRRMINQLWGDRREFQTLLISTDNVISSLVVAATPIARWLGKRVAELRNRKAGAQSCPMQAGGEEDTSNG